MAAVDVFYGKNVFSTMDPSYNKLSRDHRVQWWVEKLRKLRFSQFCIIFLYCVCFAALSASVIALKLQFTSLFLYNCLITTVE